MSLLSRKAGCHLSVPRCAAIAPITLSSVLGRFGRTDYGTLPRPRALDLCSTSCEGACLPLSSPADAHAPCKPWHRDIVTWRDHLPVTTSSITSISVDPLHRKPNHTWY